MNNKVINLEAIDTSANVEESGQYFNNLSLPVFNVSQSVDNAVQSFFETITDDKESAKILASAVMYTAYLQNNNPMEVIAEFRKLQSGEINEALAAFLNLNRIPTSLLGVKNTIRTNQYIKRAILR